MKAARGFKSHLLRQKKPQPNLAVGRGFFHSGAEGALRNHVAAKRRRGEGGTATFKRKSQDLAQQIGATRRPPPPLQKLIYVI